MDNIFSKKNVIGHILDYLEISDFLNLELADSNIKSCVDFYYEMKNKQLNLIDKNVKLTAEKIVRRNSKINKQNLTKYKKNYISKYFNSFVIFPINEEFDFEEDLNNNEKYANKEELILDKLDFFKSKKDINNAKFHRNCVNSQLENLSYFFDSK